MSVQSQPASSQSKEGWWHHLWADMTQNSTIEISTKTDKDLDDATYHPVPRPGEYAPGQGVNRKFTFISWIWRF